MLWCSSHATLASEEIPLYLDAGFRVIPLLTDFWTFEYRKTLDQEISAEWKASVDLPPKVIEKIQGITFCQDFGRHSICPDAIELLNKHVDAIYMSVLPNLAIRLTKSFDGSVVFRPFGHAELNTYSRITTAFEQPSSNLTPASNYIWCPILSTLQCAESRPMWTTPVHVGCFVTRNRLTVKDWRADQTDPIVLETIPRINKQDYYRNIYEEYIRQHGNLPLRILGGNLKHGGEINDPRILGHLPNEEYHQAILASRVCIYHGRSPYHLHYHPLEFMSVGVPVLFHTNSAIAWESRFAGLSEDRLISYGMYSTSEQANSMAQEALESQEYAEQLSHSQRFFMETLFSRPKALQQAIWLKTVIISQLNDSKRLLPLPGILQTEVANVDSVDEVDRVQEVEQTKIAKAIDSEQQTKFQWGKAMSNNLRRMKKSLVSRLSKAS